MLLPPPGNWRNFLLITLLFGAGQVSYAFFVLRASDAGIGLVLIPLFYALYSAVYAAFALPAGILTDKLGAKKMLALTFVAFALTCACFGVFGNAWGFLLAFAIYGLYMGAYETVARIYIAKHFPDQRIGGGLGAYQLAIGMSALPNGIIVGLLYPMQIFGVSAAFAFGAAVALISACGALMFLDGKK